VHDAIVVHKPAPLEREDVRVRLLNRAITVLVGAGNERGDRLDSGGTLSRFSCDIAAQYPARSRLRQWRASS